MIRVYSFEGSALADIRLACSSFTGYLIRDFVYELLSKVNAEYVERLRRGLEPGRPAPFSVMPPLGAGNDGVRLLWHGIRRKALFRFEVRSLDDEFSNTFDKAIAGKLGDTISLSKSGTVEVLSLDSHEVNTKDFLDSFRESDLLHSRGFTVEFLTPTYFRVKIPTALRQDVEKCRLIKFPDARSILLSPYRLWNSFLEPKVPEDFLGWILRMGVAVSGFTRLTTCRFVRYKEAKRIVDSGFTGVVHFAFLRDVYEAEMVKHTLMLMKMAEYTNIGGSRTAGFGLIKLMTRNGNLGNQAEKNRGQENWYVQS